MKRTVFYLAIILAVFCLNSCASKKEPVYETHAIEVLDMISETDDTEPKEQIEADVAVTGIVEDGELFFREGMMYRSQNEERMAVTSFIKAIPLLQVQNEKMMCDAIYNIGFCYYTLKEWGNAISYMEKALVYFPDDQDLKDFLASARDWKELS